MTRTLAEVFDHAKAPARRRDCLSVSGDGRALIYPCDRRTSAVELVGLARALWERFDGQRPINELAADLGEAFGMEPSEVMDPLNELLRRLEHAGVLKVVRPESVAVGARHLDGELAQLTAPRNPMGSSPALRYQPADDRASRTASKYQRMPGSSSAP